VSEKQKCANCRFWLAWESDDDAESAYADFPLSRHQGWCRRNPPVPGDPTFEPLGGSPVVLGQWLVTRSTQWCGEWSAANPQTVDDAATVMARHVLAGDAGAARQLADKLIELIPLPVVTPEE
jgi:hypothetical protein